MFILVLPDGVASFTCPLWVQYKTVLFFLGLFPFHRTLDPLDLWSTNHKRNILEELKWTRWCHFCWDGKKKRETESVAALLKCFSFLMSTTNTVSSVLLVN